MIRDFGSNPYLVTIALVITISPVVLQISRGLRTAIQRLILSIRIGFKRQAARQITSAIRGKVRKDEMGYFTRYKLSSQDVFILVSKHFHALAFYISSASALYFIFYSMNAFPPLVGVSIYSSFAGVAGMFLIQSELEAIIWRKRFVLRNMEKKLKAMEQLRETLEQEREALIAASETQTDAGEAST